MRRSLLLLFFFLCLSSTNYTQNRPLDMAIIGEALKNFTLSVYNGGEFQLSSTIGKNILLVFPRGYYDKDIWCDICSYEYLDFIDEFHNKKLDEKYNLEVVFILPYNDSTISKWLTDMPDVYKSFDASKYPADTANNERAMTWAHFSQKHYPKTFSVKNGEIPVPYKILADKDHLLSDRLEIFKNEWRGTKVEQNMPTIILLDTTGTVLFKYIAQHTIDRPGSAYLKILMDILLTKKSGSIRSPDRNVR